MSGRSTARGKKTAEFAKGLVELHSNRPHHQPRGVVPEEGHDTPASSLLQMYPTLGYCSSSMGH